MEPRGKPEAWGLDVAVDWPVCTSSNSRRGLNQQTPVSGAADWNRGRDSKHLEYCRLNQWSRDSGAGWNGLPAQADPVSPALEGQLGQDVKAGREELKPRGTHQWPLKMASKTESSKGSWAARLYFLLSPNVIRSLRWTLLLPPIC